MDEYYLLDFNRQNNEIAYYGNLDLYSSMMESVFLVAPMCRGRLLVSGTLRPPKSAPLILGDFG